MLLIQPKFRQQVHQGQMMGKVIMGQHHGPAYTMSLGADWRGTVSAVGDSSYNVFQGHTTPRVIYQSPNIAGFQVGTSVSQGTDSLGAESQTGLNYSIPFNDSMIKIGHSFSSVDAVAGVDVKKKHSETGIQFTHGKFTASFLKFKQQKSGSVTTTSQTQYVQPVTIHYDSILIPGHNPAQIRYREVAQEQCDFEGSHGGIPCFPGKDGKFYTLSEYVSSSSSGELKLPATSIPARDVMTRDVVTSQDMSEDVEGKEFELAYAVNDDLTVNVVKFTKETTDASNKTASYDRTSIGGKYTIAPGLTASLSHSMIDNAGTDEDAMRFRLNYSF